MTTPNKEILFSLSKKDFDVETFRCPGKGGQNVNKVNSGVRITHRASGVSVRCCDERDQLKNKKLAFKRLTETKAFQAWLKVEAARVTGVLAQIEEKVDREMTRVKVESKNEDGRWVEGLTEKKCGSYGCTNTPTIMGIWCESCYEDYKEDPEAYK